MQIGMIGLGRMGAAMVRRLLRSGHECAVFDVQATNITPLVELGARGASSLEQLVALLTPPRSIWMMVPAAIVEDQVQKLASLLQAGDCLIDGGNSYYHDDIRRAEALFTKGIDYLDVGTSGGVWGEERGYCLMIGGKEEVYKRLEPIFKTLAPGIEAAPRTQGKAGDPAPEEQGYLYCGPSGAGHFVKMVHNGIEYGIMAAYAEGFNVLYKADAGKEQYAADAETAPLRDSAYYRYTFDLAAISELWRRGSVIPSWLLDLLVRALRTSPELSGFSGRVSDSGEGRWTLAAAIDEGVPVPVLSAAVYERFFSRGEAAFADKIVSAMRFQFGGHTEKTEN
ncbi:MAG: decarboxylating 6-phosphogluconate dehydrogenase [Chloroflexi bacterium]|nr:decarboxylating 6-phosphogluconate dehydrogenase [Chloroflexota bacterium]